MMKYDARSPRSDSAIREHSDSSMAPRMKRLTIDVSAELHSAIKVDCARKGIKMADAIRDLLASEFGEGAH